VAGQGRVRPWTKQLREIAEGRLERAMHDMVVRNAATFPGLAPPGGERDLMPIPGLACVEELLAGDLAPLPDAGNDAFWPARRAGQRPVAEYLLARRCRAWSTCGRRRSVSSASRTADQVTWGTQKRLMAMA